MPEKYSYYKFLQKLKGNKLTQTEINVFVEKSVMIASTYIKLMYSKIHKLMKTNDMKIEDVAIEALARLFVRNEKNEFYVIIETMNSWEPEVKDEETAFYFVNKLISNRVAQNVGNLLKEADPFFTKILDTIIHVAKKLNYSKRNFFGVTYLVESHDDKFDAALIDDETFEKLSIDYTHDSANILKTIFEYLKKDTNYYPAIPLNALIHKIKHASFNSIKIENKLHSASNSIEVDQYVEFGYETAVEKLNTTYLKKGKLDLSEAASFQNALKDITIDLKNGGMSPGLYGYLEPYLPGLSSQKYQLKYHNMLEYLVKVMKSTISQQLSQEI